MGCGKTLFVGNGGHITCSWVQCPNPAAVDEILANAETEHIVEIVGNKPPEVRVKHPLRERVNDELFECELYAECLSVMHSRRPIKSGTYRVRRTDRVGWNWEEING